MIFGSQIAYPHLMNKTWVLTIFGITFILLSVLRAHELRKLSTFYKGERTIKLESFTDARKKVNKDELDLLKLWESMLTGRSAPLSRLMKEEYKSLGLNHLFTPSGFHLSAAVFPFIKLLHKKFHLTALILVGSLFFFLPGLGALKRMLVIKTHQHVLGLHAGFICALLVDVFFGTFQTGALSFTYSFLFLGIIYSGAKGVALILWFFVGQIFLAYFQNSDISLLLLIFSPILNFAFGITMPVLFALSFPLWDWQLSIGLFLLKYLQSMVSLFSDFIFQLPFIEVHIGVLLFIALLIYKKRKEGLILFCLLTPSLNMDRQKAPGPSTNEFVPRGKLTETRISEDFVSVSYEDGNCRLRQVRGLWHENCSPKRRSSRSKKLKKLSYPS